MSKSFLLLFVGLFLYDDVVSFNPLLTYTVRFKKISIYPNVSFHYTIDQIRENQFINGNMTIKSKESPDNVVGIFYRCAPEGINCEYWQTWKLSDICSKLKEKNQVWSSWYGAFHPPMICPINNINYQIHNASIDVGPGILLYPEGTDYQWRVTQKFYAGDVYVGGYTMDMFIFGYRKRPKPILKTEKKN